MADSAESVCGTTAGPTAGPNSGPTTGSIAGPDPNAHAETPAETAPETAADVDRPTSCLGCRKRKLRCSRDLPSCLHCQRLAVTCEYDAKRGKPGLRPGAVEALSQRIAVLEAALAGRSAGSATTPAPVPASMPDHAGVVGILAVLAQELHKLNSTTAACAAARLSATAPVATPLSLTTAPTASTASPASPLTVYGHGHGHGHDHDIDPPRKRRRMVDSCGNPDNDLVQPLADMEAAAAAAEAATSAHRPQSSGLPPPETLQAVVRAYFAAVQPWIPVLHETQFRRRMHDAAQRPRLTCVLQAMVVAAARHVAPDDVPDGAGLDGLVRAAQQSRGAVLLAAMDGGLSVESLQALLILAFDDIGSGATARAWPIVAMLTRSVAYLGLNVEDDGDGCAGREDGEEDGPRDEDGRADEHPADERRAGERRHDPSREKSREKSRETSREKSREDANGRDDGRRPANHPGSHPDDATHPRRPLLRAVALLDAPHNWIEAEERRRVFWCVLLLDRFCAVATGWSPGLAVADVQRRLPADGFFFHKEEPVLTPYMYGPADGGEADAGAADDRGRDRDRDLGDCHDHCEHRDHRDRNRDHRDCRDPRDCRDHRDHRDRHRHRDRHEPAPSTPSMAVHGPPGGNMANAGAFAYCIEAAESLSRVVTAFLRQRVDFGDRPDVGRWLTRFKELDLRLVHWKMYLPQRWRDSNVSRQPALVNMDPNLTLAHVTHNTSTILLHQRVAYPDAAWWTRIVQLPSVCSAETCHNAAVETAAITSKYLRYTPRHRPVASQFAFCVYISARVLLVHSRSNGRDGRDGHPDTRPVDVLPEFWSLLHSLEDMDRRWTGRDRHGRTGPSLAGHYAQRLKDLHRQCLDSPSFVGHVLGYTEFEPTTAAVQQSATDEAPDPADRSTAGTAVETVTVGQTGQSVPAVQSAPSAQSAQSVHPVQSVQPVQPVQPVQAVQVVQNAPAVTTVTPATTVPEPAPLPVQPTPPWPLPMQSLDHMSPAMPTYSYALTDTTASAYAAASVVSVPTGPARHTDDLAAISHLLLDQQFMDRDRVISFEDSFFAAPGRWT